MAEEQNQSRNMSEVRRLVGMIWEPTPVFQDLVARPRFWAPLILLSLLSVGYVFTFSKVIGWEAFMRQQMETNPKVQERMQQLSPEKRQQAIETFTKLGVVFGYAGASVGFAISSLVIAAIFLGVFNAFGSAELTFKKVFSIICYSFVPTILATILSVVTMFLKKPEDFDLQNPLLLNVGAWLDPQGTPKWLHSIASSLDLFSIWPMLLIALGLSVAGRRVAFGRSLTYVVVLWAVWVAVKAGWATITG